MTGYVLRRAAQAALTMFVAVVLIFIAMRALPGSPLLAKFGQHTDPEQMRRIAEAQGWNKPLYVQLADYLWNAILRGDLGESIARSNERVSQELLRRVPATIELTLAAMVLAVPLGVGSGVAAAVWRNRWPDYLCMAGSLLGVSVPVFFLGILLRAVFTGFPTSQRLPLGVIDFEPLSGLYLADTLLRGRFELFLPAVTHLCLPALALSSIPTAIIARITRSSLLEVLSTDYVRTAKAKGAAFWRVVLRHALPNAAVPVANIAGFQLGLLFSGAVLTETVFDWPGLGRYVATAVHDLDYPVAQACALAIAGMFVCTNLLLDLLYVWLDPRIRHAAEAH